MGRPLESKDGWVGAARQVSLALAVVLLVLPLVSAPVRAEYVQQAKLTTTAGPSERLGSSVAVSADGTVAVAGAGNNGAPYVFVRESATWSQRARLTASDALYGLGQFGVAISGDGTVIAAAGVVAAYTQAVYVFVREGATWVQQAKLTAGNGTDSNFFGAALALSADGGTLVVGDGNAMTMGSSSFGAAYVFVRTGATWARQAQLAPKPEDARYLYGVSVAVSADGSVALVGNQAYGNPSAYVFVRNGATWSQQTKLVGPLDPYETSGFGVAVALSGDGRTAAVGAPYEISSTGAAYLFTRSGTMWERVARLTSDDATASGFARRVAMSSDGGTLVATATRYSESGSAYVFRGGGATWTRTRMLAASDAGNNDHFGTALAVSEGGLVVTVGAQDNNAIGAVYAFFDRLLVRVRVAPAGGVSDGTPTVGIGETLSLTATSMYNDGTTQAATGVTWATSDAGRATVDGAGRVTGVAAGPVTVMGTKDGITGRFTLVVTAPSSAISLPVPRPGGDSPVMVSPIVPTRVSSPVEATPNALPSRR